MHINRQISHNAFNNACWPGRIYQIDGNLGVAAAVVERARGGYEVDITWRDGKLTKAVVHPKVDGTCRIRYGEKTVVLKLKKGTSCCLDSRLTPLRA